jgi:hypothetical protein
MGIPTACGGTLPIAELDQDRRGLRIALRYVPAGQKALLARANNSVEQSYRHLNDQPASCRDNAPPPTPLSTALTGHPGAGRPPCFVPSLGASRCWTRSRRIADFAGYVADLTHSCTGSEDYAV